MFLVLLSRTPTFIIWQPNRILIQTNLNFTLDKLLKWCSIVSALGFQKKTEISVSNNFRNGSTTRSLRLEEVTISSKLPAMNVISRIDLENPTGKFTSQRNFTQSSWLFIGQHAGVEERGSEQIFLRGFQIMVHITLISVDGMPVNTWFLNTDRLCWLVW
jgi:hypothetical protein